VCVLAAPAAAQVALPETPAGRQFARWLDLFNRTPAGAVNAAPAPAPDASAGLLRAAR
jgi:hypothetical protein